MTNAVNTVVLVDDHDLIRQGLARAFERHEDFSVVAEADSVADGLEEVAVSQTHGGRHGRPIARRHRAGPGAGCA